MYCKYNMVLRGLGALQAVGEGDITEVMRNLCRGNNYGTTLHVINSSIIKLSKARPEAR